MGLKTPTSGVGACTGMEGATQSCKLENGTLQEEKGDVLDSFHAQERTLGETWTAGWQVGCREIDLGLMSLGNQKGPRSKASRGATGLGGRSPGHGVSSPRTHSWARGRPAHPARALPVA